jgi:hypothetical protein
MDLQGRVVVSQFLSIPLQLVRNLPPVFIEYHVSDQVINEGTVHTVAVTVPCQQQVTKIFY